MKILNRNVLTGIMGPEYTSCRVLLAFPTLPLLPSQSLHPPPSEVINHSSLAHSTPAADNEHTHLHHTPPATGIMVNLGDVFPNFTANSTEGSIKLHSYLGDK